MSSQRVSPLLLLSVACLSASTARADLITGQVVDEHGIGVAGVDIDAKDLVDGDDANLSNDTTDANGFFSTTIDLGLYRITFKPPAPPVASSLVLELDNVSVVGTTILGVLALPEGVALSGTVVDPFNAPVNGLDLDVRDLTTNDDVTLIGGFTNAFGNYSIVVPPSPIELRFDTSSVGLPLFAPGRVLLDLAVDTNIGTFQLQPGFLVTATVERMNGSGLFNVDFDAIDVVTDEELFTPGDNTDGSGFVDFIVPAGTYDFEVCPQFADLVVAATLDSVVVPGSGALGLIVLQPGVVLSGHVEDTSGTPVETADLDLRDATTLVGVSLCGDNTNAAGNYAIIVPTGTFNVTFSPPPGAPMSPVVVMGYAISGNQILNVTLPDGGGGNYCQSNPFSTGQPSTMHSNLATVSIAANDLVLTADNLPSQPGQFIASSAPSELPFQNGFLCVNPTGLQRLLPISLPDAGGVATIAVDFVAGAQGLAGSIPMNVVAGTTHYFQRWNRDPGAGTGSNLSDGIAIELVP